jgi:hypothetical protein
LDQSFCSLAAGARRSRNGGSDTHSRSKDTNLAPSKNVTQTSNTGLIGDGCVTVTLIGIYAAIATSWTPPTAFLSGTAAAGGLALINSIGNLGGFAGPYFMGWIKTATGEFSLGFLLIGVGLALSAGIALAMRGAVASEHADEVVAPSALPS